MFARLNSPITLNRTTIETILIAVPIILISLWAVIQPSEDVGFLDSLLSKPEWYFLTIVFFVETHRDIDRLKSISQKTSNEHDYTSNSNLNVCLIVIAVALTAGSFFNAHSQLHSAANISIKYSFNFKFLSIISVPLFLSAAIWNGLHRAKLHELEKIRETEISDFYNSKKTKIYRTADSSKVKDFYNLVADVYNKRNDNSNGIRNAQNSIVDTVRQTIRCSSAEDTNSVCDIGGGTGYNIFNSLRDEVNLTWTHIDISNEMTRRFKENFGDHKPPVNIYTYDCLKIGDDLFKDEGEKFDIIIFSFVLSSLSRSINFKNFYNLLKPNGKIIIADIHPGYIAKSPRFDVDVNNTQHALELRKVETLNLENDALIAGLFRQNWHLFKNERDETYSFVFEFIRDIDRTKE